MRWAPTILLLVAGAACGWWQYERRAELQRAIEEVKPLAAEAQRLSWAGNVQPRVGVAPAEQERQQREHQELLRLRGEIGDLRQRGSRTEAELQGALTTAREATQAAAREMEKITERRKAEELKEETRNFLVGYAQLISGAARYSNLGVPGSLDELRSALQPDWKPTSERPPERMSRIQSGLRAMLVEMETNAGESVRKFEYLPVNEALDPTIKGVAGRTLVLREREPRPLPDGGWARAYGLLDGTIREATSKTGDFSEWEREVRDGPPERKPVAGP